MKNDVKVADKEKEKEKIICTCTGTTQSKILQLINKGRDTLDEIASATGASTGCGSCDATIMDIIKERNSSAD